MALTSPNYLSNFDQNESYVVLKGVSKNFGDIKAVSEISLEIRKGEFFSLLGPSGCGKTTILRLIAGLERPDRGVIKIGASFVAGESWVPPEKRNVGFVFQDYALFPHMTVFENIAFGLRGLSKKELNDRVRELLEMVDLPEVAKRYPHELSGGQQQRVALARALAISPKIMLLDEPFSNLDTDLRAEIRMATKKILKERETTTILVTHDQEEAFALSDRIGVLNGGKLEQVGKPEEIYHRPLTRFVANFVGRANFIKARIEGELLISDIGIIKCKTPLNFYNQEIELMIRPDYVDFVEDPKGEGLIVDREFLGPVILYRIRLPIGETILSLKPSTKIFQPGFRVKLNIDPSHIIFFSGNQCI